MSVYASGAADKTGQGEAGRGCRDPGLARLSSAVLVARGRAIFSGQRQETSSGGCLFALMGGSQVFSIRSESSL